MKIGGINVKGRLFLAPMSNITSMPFRILCKKYGASFVYSEMVNAEAYIRDSGKTRKRALFLKQERPIGIQLMGSSITCLKRAAVKAEQEMKPDVIDINIGCPAYNVMKSGSGASLLENPDLLQKIVGTLSALKTPLTCKIRILEKDEKTIELAKLIEKSGAKAITIHGRTPEQKYTGKANWGAIKKAKSALSIPVILNGDVKDEISAERAFRETGCDSVMLGRAAIGNPFIFRAINYYLETGQLIKKQSLKEKMEDFLCFVELCRRHGFVNICSIKMQAQCFVKGMKASNLLRKKISECRTIEEIISLMMEFSESEPL